MKHAIIIAMLLAATSAIADPGDKHLVLHGASHHSTQRTGVPWNETNPGMALRYELTNTVSVQAGFYKNSYYRQSMYAGVDWTPVSFGPLSFGVFGGAASGYKDKAGAVAGGLIRLQGDPVSITLRVVPAGKRQSISMVEIGWRF